MCDVLTDEIRSSVSPSHGVPSSFSSRVNHPARPPAKQTVVSLSLSFARTNCALNRRRHTNTHAPRRSPPVAASVAVVTPALLAPPLINLSPPQSKDPIKHLSLPACSHCCPAISCPSLAFCFLTSRKHACRPHAPPRSCAAAAHFFAPRRPLLPPPFLARGDHCAISLPAGYAHCVRTHQKPYRHTHMRARARVNKR